jgi:hypothetical protein
MDQTLMNEGAEQHDRGFDIYIMPKEVIINLLKADHKHYVTRDRLFQFLDYIRKQLVEYGSLPENVHRVIFRVNWDSVERTVRYNDDLFDLIGETIYYRQDLNNLSNVSSTDTCINLSELATKFVNEAA